MSTGSMSSTLRSIGSIDFNRLFLGLVFAGVALFALILYAPSHPSAPFSPTPVEPAVPSQIPPALPKVCPNCPKRPCPKFSVVCPRCRTALIVKPEETGETGALVAPVSPIAPQ